MMIRNTARALGATLLTIGLLGGCAVPEEGIDDSEFAFDEDGNGAQTKPKGKKDGPKQDTGPKLTVSQENAIAKAQDYLEYSAFSKTGLIEQLEFEGFPAKDARYAANHIRVNWNQQAAAKAKQYLETSSYSRQGLIEQLEFEGFTRDQAEYGTSQAGL